MTKSELVLVVAKDILVEGIRAKNIAIEVVPGVEQEEWAVHTYAKQLESLAIKVGAIYDKING